MNLQVNFLLVMPFGHGLGHTTWSYHFVITLGQATWSGHLVMFIDMLLGHGHGHGHGHGYAIYSCHLVMSHRLPLF